MNTKQRVFYFNRGPLGAVSAFKPTSAMCPINTLSCCAFSSTERIHDHCGKVSDCSLVGRNSWNNKQLILKQEPIRHKPCPIHIFKDCHEKVMSKS